MMMFVSLCFIFSFYFNACSQIAINKDVYKWKVMET